MSETINLENKRELFVDYHFIDNMNGTTLKLHHPTPANIAVKYDQPWETDDQGSGSFYTTVFQDGDIFRMYYRGHITNVCYAESKDGINWDKPALGLFSKKGFEKNNILMEMPHSRSFFTFLDNRPGVSESEKYKSNMERNRGVDRDGVNLYASKDGKRFNRFGGDPGVPMTLPNHFDSQNPMFWSEIEQQYVMYARYMVGFDGLLGENYRELDLDHRIRSTARATSSDCINWSDFNPMKFSDTDSITPSAQLYTNQTTPYFRANHIYISLPGRIFFKKIKKSYASKGGKYKYYTGGYEDTSDAAFMTTRAGSTRYDFTFRESLLRPGIGDENWTTRNNYPACGVIQTGETEMSIFVQRHYAQTSAYLERMTLRLDGFASLNTGYDEGQMITKPVYFTGNKLELNYSTSAAGSIRVEILDESGTLIDGYGIDDCDGLIGDEISGYVSWKGSTDLSKISGKPVRVRFVMNDADIYSLRFES